MVVLKHIMENRAIKRSSQKMFIDGLLSDIPVPRVRYGQKHNNAHGFAP